MAKAMSRKSIIAAAQAKGFGFIARGVDDTRPKLYPCPDCKAVYTAWAEKDVEPRAYTTVLALKKEDVVIGACPCGWRKMGDDIHHSERWLKIFGPARSSSEAPPVVPTPEAPPVVKKTRAKKAAKKTEKTDVSALI